MRSKVLIVLALVLALVAGTVMTASAVSGAAFTTFNAHVDGAGKDVCKNTDINCNIYGAKEYVWLNGGPTANGLGPDGEYFFAVLVPGGQPNPNDGRPKNLSDDFDEYTNRTFTVTDGEVSVYRGTHWLDSGKKESNPDEKPNGLPPYIRLFPYADTTNPGGVYIMAICSLEDGYPVDPRDCKYDAFKVKKGKLDYAFMLNGMKFEDVYGDAIKDDTDPGLAGWQITITGTGFDGGAISATVTTGEGGYWEWYSPVYTFTAGATPVAAQLKVCEVLQEGWVQTYPAINEGCHDVIIEPAAFASIFDIDLGNYDPVDVTACKVRDLDGVPGGDTVPVAGWMVSRTEAGVVVATEPTGEDGCYTWTDLPVGIVYDVHEETRAGWRPMGPVDWVFERAASGQTYTHTFVNVPLEGCTPGFWQGGNDFGTAGGKWLWNEDDDPQWAAKGGAGSNPYIWTTLFNDFFTKYDGLNGFDMMSLVGTGGGPDDFQKAGRSLVAAYLNASWGMGYPYSTTQLSAMWTAAVSSGEFLALHTELDAANNAYYREPDSERCPISASMP